MRTKLYSLIALSLTGVASLSPGDATAQDLGGTFLQNDGKPLAARSARSPILRGVASGDPLVIHRDGEYIVKSEALRGDSGQEVGSLITVTKDDGSFVALVDTPFEKGTVVARPDGSQRFIAAPANSFMQHDAIELPESHTVTAEGDAIGDIDSQGVAIVDLLAGFSKAAADRVGDPRAYALGQVESVNLTLRNSNVTTARLRLAGIQVIDTDHPITTGKDGTLQKVPTLFADGMKRYSPDLVAGFFNGGTGGGTAEGWGFVPGRYSIQHVRSPKAFRHEIAHNVGGSHCNSGQNSYKFGYNNGKSRSALCGNSSDYYSTPLLTDAHGLPRGNAQTADMARLWRERAPAMSAHAKTVIPLD